MNKTIVEEYLSYYSFYYKKYGNKTCVLLMSGMFYECYSTFNPNANDNKIEPNLHELSELLNIICTRKDKSISTISLKNPYLLGFPIVSSSKFIKILVDNDYTVIVIDQVTLPPNPKRKVTGIYSASTFIDNITNHNSNYTACIYIEENNKILSIGTAAIDVSTGKNIIYECHSSFEDKKKALDDTIIFLSTISPRELLIHNKSNLDKDFLISYMDLDKKYCHYYNTIDDKYCKLNFQNEMLRNVFNKYNTLISPIEYLELERLIYATISLVRVIDFLIDHNNKLLKDIDKPIIYSTNKHLILGNNASYQLNIENTDKNNKTKYKSLLDVINIASTAIGKRFIRNRILTPLINKNDLENIYDNVDLLIKDDNWKNIEHYLTQIQDLERLGRRITLKIINPYEMSDFIKSLETIKDMHTYISENIPLLAFNGKIKKLNKLLKYCKKYFNLDKLKLYPLSDIKDSFFNNGIFEDIDKMCSDINHGHTFIDDVKIAIKNIFDDNKISFKINKNDRDGYYIQMTKIKANILKQKLSALDCIYIKDHVLEVKNITFNDNGKNVKIYFPFLKEKSSEMTKSKENLCDMVKNKYFDCCEYINLKYLIFIKKICVHIGNLDYYKTIAKTAKIYNYTRPQIKDNENGYIECKNLRHPIVERLIDYEYSPHDIKIGNELKGMLIYGINSSGKSVLMKALGLSIIMAQSGFYVPATEYIFSPYNYIYTRILSQDNIFKGLSSFVIEMLELNSIIKRANEKTLVIGDEVTRGTESISGSSIVSATLIKLSDVKASFIFATHLHDIIELDVIKNLTTLKAFYLSFTYDTNTNAIIYDRKLKEGNGDKIYGLNVAKYIIDNSDFMEMANDIKNKLLNKYDSFIPNKKSRYNNGIYVYQCQLCKAHATKDNNLESHHINFQKDSVNGFINNKNHIPLHSAANIIILCDNCHKSLHKDNVQISGYVMSTTGKKIY